MQTTHFIHKRLTKSHKLHRVGLYALMSFLAVVGNVSGAHLNHDFALSSLNNEIRKNKLAQMSHSISASSPHICCLPGIGSMLLGSSRRNKATERIFKPIYKKLIGIRDLNISLVIRDLGLRIAAKVSDVNTSFSIYNSGKIGYLSNGVFLRDITIAIHGNSCNILKCVYTLQNNIKDGQPQRLSPLALRNKGCDSLNSWETTRGRNNKTPRLEIGLQVTESQNQDPVLNECAARLGVSLRQTEDQLTRDMLAGTAAFINSTGGFNGDNPTEITRSDVDTVVRGLLNNNAYTIMDNIEGEDKFGTAPVRDAYFALCSTNLTGNLDNVNGFIQKNQYPAPMNALRSEWGAIGNLRFLVSSIGSVTPNSSNLGANVYNIFCVGMEAYA
jgi:hypothetical protein